MPGSYRPITIQTIASALTLQALTPREIQALPPLDFHRTTVRTVLGQLARDGRAIAEGDVFQKRYRLAEDAAKPIF